LTVSCPLRRTSNFLNLKRYVEHQIIGLEKEGNGEIQYKALELWTTLDPPRVVQYMKKEKGRNQKEEKQNKQDREGRK
jgi:hypothetical protein